MRPGLGGGGALANRQNRVLAGNAAAGPQLLEGYSGHLVLNDLSFSVMPDHSAIIAAPVGTQDTDIGLFRLTRNDAH